MDLTFAPRPDRCVLTEFIHCKLRMCYNKLGAGWSIKVLQPHKQDGMLGYWD
jgi:hypothetical protein